MMFKFYKEELDVAKRSGKIHIRGSTCMGSTITIVRDMFHSLYTFFFDTYVYVFSLCQFKILPYAMYHNV